MEQFLTLFIVAGVGYVIVDFVMRALRGPYRCSCGYETYNADEALRHQGHKSHTME